MKKSLKMISIVLLCGMMLIALTGCGNKIKATREEDEVKETLELTLKGDKVIKQKMTMEFENKEDAEELYEFITEGLDEEDDDETEIKLKGKKIIMSVKGDLAEEQYEDMSKEEIIEYLEDSDYKVK